MKILITLLVIISLGLNAFLWKVASDQRKQLAALQARINETEAARLKSEEQQAIGNAAPGTASEVDVKELARLRSEVGPLRKLSTELESLRAQAAEVGQLRAQLAAARKDVAAAAAREAEAVKLTPEDLQAMKGQAQSIRCVNNLKQIGLAARLYAQSHGQVFPPDFVTMRNELASPNILFCAAAPGGVQTTDWAQLNPATISYQLLNPNGALTDRQKPLATCPIHGATALSDGSVYRGDK